MSSRRVFARHCGGVLLAGGWLRCLAAAPKSASAATSAGRLDPSEARARAVGYVLDTRDADMHKYPHHKNEQRCGNCQRFAATNATTGACNYFRGASTVAAAWCSAYCPANLKIDPADRSCRW